MDVSGFSSLDDIGDEDPDNYILSCKGTALFPPQDCITMLWSDLSLFKYY